MDNYFTSFCLLTHLGVNNIRAREVFNKNRLRKYTIIGDKQLRNRYFEQCRDIKQKCCVACVAGKNDMRALYIASSEFCQPNRNLFGIGTKLKESIFKSKNQTNSTVTTRT